MSKPTSLTSLLLVVPRLYLSLCLGAAGWITTQSWFWHGGPWVLWSWHLVEQLAWQLLVAAVGIVLLFLVVRALSLFYRGSAPTTPEEKKKWVFRGLLGEVIAAGVASLLFIYLVVLAVFFPSFLAAHQWLVYVAAAVFLSAGGAMSVLDPRAKGEGGNQS